MTTNVPQLEGMEVTVPATLVAECHASSAAESTAISAAVPAALQKIQAKDPGAPERERGPGSGCTARRVQ